MVTDKEAVDFYIDTSNDWKGELMLLRSMLLDAKMEETMRWQRPVYAIDGKNLIGIAAFTHHVGIWFFQGSYLKDEHKKLANAQEKTKNMRHWKFKTINEIIENKDIIKAYILETIANHRAGKEDKPQKNTSPLIVPPELEIALKENITLKEHYEGLSLSKRREYAEYISEAKRVSTKMKRLEKIIPMILANKGLNDQYK